MQVNLVIKSRRVGNHVDVVHDYSIDKAGRLYESKEGVGNTNNIAVLILEVRHEAPNEKQAASDGERQREYS